MRALFRDPRFVRLWLGETTSLVGDWLSMVAVYATLQQLFPGGKAVALALVAKSLPIFLVSPLAGKLAERYDLKTLMVVTTLARLALPLLLIYAFASRSLVGILALETMMALMTGLFLPAYAAAVPRLVPGPLRQQANALNSGSWSATFALGAALGGLLTSTLGFEAALLLDGLTFLVSGLILWGLPALAPRRPKTGDGVGFAPALRLLSRKPRILAPLAVRSVLCLTAGVSVALPLLGGEALQTGGLYAIRGLGFVLGSALVAVLPLPSPRAMIQGTAFGFALAGAAYLGAGFSQEFWGLATGYLLAAVGTSLVWVTSETLSQWEVPEEFRGRLFALQSGFATLTMALVSLIAGGLIDWGVSPRGLLIGSGLLAVLAGLGYGLLRAGDRPGSR